MRNPQLSHVLDSCDKLLEQNGSLLLCESLIFNDIEIKFSFFHVLSDEEEIFFVLNDLTSEGCTS